MPSEILNFLETSSIHGVLHIAKTNRLQRILWIFIVVCGFFGAGLLIRQSFQSWSESPVRTTIETLPISQLRFPKVSVCPPKNTHTNLNYDLVMNKNRNITFESRQELLHHFLELQHDKMFNKVMEDINLLTNKNRYEEWYNGYTELTLAAKIQKSDGDWVDWYRYYSFAPFGNISSRHFGEKFNVSAIQKKVVYTIEIFFKYVPINLNLTIFISIKKENMPLQIPNYDRIKIVNFGYLEAETKSFSFHIPIKGKHLSTSIVTERQADDKDLNFLGE